MRRRKALEEPLEKTLLGLYPTDKAILIKHLEKDNSNLSDFVRKAMKKEIRRYERLESA